MSIQSAKAFLELIKKNEELAKRLSECKTIKEKTLFAKSEGFDFTEQEFKDAINGLNQMDFDLLVAGGLHVTDLRRPE